MSRNRQIKREASVRRGSRHIVFRSFTGGALMGLRQGISPQLWTLFPLLYRAWDKYAYDLVSNMAVPMDNYISRGTDVFVSGATPEGHR